MYPFFQLERKREKLVRRRNGEIRHLVSYFDEGRLADVTKTDRETRGVTQEDYLRWVEEGQIQIEEAESELLKSFNRMLSAIFLTIFLVVLGLSLAMWGVYPEVLVSNLAGFLRIEISTFLLFLLFLFLGRE